VCSELNLLELVKRKIIIEKGNREGNMGELVTTVTKFKSKPGSENKLIEELRSFDNSSSKSWQVLSLGDNEYAAINTYESIENRTEDVASGLDWLDSITPLIDLYENGSRTEAFSGIVLYENE
jgi:hypothetical protein|tara:strand:+ start:4079 stop:4447 length:369 start_codon:yes stop_codon:yes gene_type:complete